MFRLARRLTGACDGDGYIRHEGKDSTYDNQGSLHVYNMQLMYISADSSQRVEVEAVTYSGDSRGGSKSFRFTRKTSELIQNISQICDPTWRSRIRQCWSRGNFEMTDSDRAKATKEIATDEY